MDGSERRAVRWTGFSRSRVCYTSYREPQEALRARIRTLAGEQPRWGYRHTHVLPRREGWTASGNESGDCTARRAWPC